VLEDRYWWYLGLRRLMKDMIARHLDGAFHSPLKGLDSGCGAGGALAYLADQFPDLHFIGFDRERMAVFYSNQRD